MTGPTGPAGVPLQDGTPLAPVTVPAGAPTVAGIACEPSEQVAYHIHVHLAVYVNGVLRPVPGGVGMVQPVGRGSPNGDFFGATSCYYWLHVHAQDGVIHIESPSVATYTLGQFFALWGQPLDAGHVGPAAGPLTIYVNGRVHTGDPSKITLTPHEDIQIDVGTPTVAPQRVDWSATGL